MEMMRVCDNTPQPMMSAPFLNYWNMLINNTNFYNGYYYMNPMNYLWKNNLPRSPWSFILNYVSNKPCLLNPSDLFHFYHFCQGFKIKYISIMRQAKVEGNIDVKNILLKCLGNKSSNIYQSYNDYSFLGFYS